MNQVILNRINTLRAAMKREGILAYIVVTDDFHGSEYVDDYFKCREYMSGFSGSAGTLVVCEDFAGLWTDGRYFLQAASQLEGTGIELMKMGEESVPTIPAFLAAHLPNDAVIGYDGRTITVSFQKAIQKAFEDAGYEAPVIRADKDLVGEQWEDRPVFPQNAIWNLDTLYTGEDRSDKIARLREKMLEQKADCLLLTSLDDIAWLFNLRGGDIAYNPVFMSYALMTKDVITLYTSQEAIAPVKDILLGANEEIRLAPYLQVYEDMALLKDGQVIQIDENEINAALRGKIPASVLVKAVNSPVRMMKGVKNETEMDCIRKAHIWDGVAVTKLLYYLQQPETIKAFQEGSVTELDVADKLLKLRQAVPDFIDQSFSPIIASGEHGAIIHYDPCDGGNGPIQMNTFLLMDTGAQFTTGTTDITRTVAIGEVSQEMKRHYTAVLRGNLNLAAARFKQGVTGPNLDVLARMPLWDLNLDYNHGTGHGVGFVLNVHEGPQSIRGKDPVRDGAIALKPGMLTSDEPGVYLENRYGIRLENLMLCVKDCDSEYGSFNRFETVTMVPFDRASILAEDMLPAEIELLNKYHATVFEKVAPYLSQAEKEWLALETAAF